MFDPHDDAFPALVGSESPGLTKREWMLTMVIQGMLASGRVSGIGHMVEDGMKVVRAMEEALNAGR